MACATPATAARLPARLLVVMVLTLAASIATGAWAAPRGGFSAAEYVDNIRRGGPPKDGIPSIDEPRFVAASAADYLAPDDIVFGVEHNGEARAYPQRILVWHEIVNDRVGGRNVAVTYCPLTGTAMGYYRGDTTFGVSGLLVNSNLIMYDRATDSSWPQILGAAIRGQREGETLTSFPVIWTTWAAWRSEHPDTRVLSLDTGYARDYNRDPYGSYNPRGGYYEPGSGLLFDVMHADSRFDRKTVVVTARTDGGPVALSRAAITAAGSRHFTRGGEHYTAVHDPALDTVRVFRNPDRLALAPDGTPRDAAAAGDAVTPVVTWDAFWFAWVAFHPDTAVVGGS